MASSSSSVPPSNPFDGFDSYSTVAAPAMTVTTRQHQPPPPSQYSQQPQQQPSSPTPQMHQEWQRPVAAMASPYFAAQMLPMPGMSPQPVQQQPVVQQQQQELVPAAPSAMSPWALSPNPPPSAGQLTASNAFPPQQQHPILMDPFAVQLPMQQQQQQLVPQPQYQQQLLSPQYQIPPPQMPPQQQQSTTPQQRLHNELQGFFNDETPQNKPSVLPDETEEEGLGLIDVELDDDENNTSNNNHTNNERRKADGEFFGKHQHHHQNQHSSSSSPLRDKYADIAPPPPITPARHHAEYLAQQTTRTPSGSITSPLPQPSLVLHSGYVLSRISFRTVLLRKWKQTFWIQYGPTQLLFFRSFADYEDWLNNPYHSQRARDFLIKLRVDFVSDLKKTSVMGYQVTQIRRKPYGKNVMLHFKLERWMDYGPTIAAAFAAREEEMVHSPTHRSNTNRRRGGGGNDNDDDDDDGDNFMNTTNDVASLRKIILGCMRNARDAALVASRGGYGGGSGEAEDMYRGRYNNDGGDYHNNSAASAGVGGIMNDRSGTVNMGYHQAFSAESTSRRRMDMDEIKENNNSSSAEKSSVKTEESAEATTTMAPPAAITNGVVDLLG